ncbi:Endonuclease/exonuclease/phosphatase [Parasponia andersonii]|uniref:Endonuclease/exonuclease/phosphatase n=1 Tax=Parasponia andersonii TaxID=3476 RepID=A0A2P5C084_PARAD|nr:Endonuclease/exonuclease/phosphatase [Parasponia andersonii]
MRFCACLRNFGGIDRSAAAMSHIRTSLLDCGLCDLGFSGFPYTWMNKRRNDDFIQEKLDRYFCSDDWRQLFTHWLVEHGDFLSSYHCPVFLWLEKGMEDLVETSHTGFKFESFWLKEIGCQEVVEETWMGESFSNNVLFDFQGQLDSCVARLKTWSAQTFRSLRKSIKRTRKRISQLYKVSDVAGKVGEIRILENKLEDLLNKEETY